MVNTVINKYAPYKNIIFSGYVSDLDSYYEESVMIVPILSGSGIRTKILTSFANKVPVFATEFASEGLLDFERGNSHVALFNNNSEFLNLFLNTCLIHKQSPPPLWGWGGGGGGGGGTPPQKGQNTRF